MFGAGPQADRELGKAHAEAVEREHSALFVSLMSECKYGAPGARLSAKLRAALERLRPGARRAVCSRTRDGCAPLFVASQRGNVEVVEFLVHVCDADVEQRGLFEVADDRSVHTVTPLWCAAVCGRLAVVRALADAGADLDAASDSGSTPVRSACFMSHADVVRLLVERGADVHRANHNGGTCLINSVQSVRLCEFLVSRGAEVNARDSQLKTVLHYAIQEHRVETVRLLLDRGADPLLESRAGDDALRTACLKGATAVVRLLAARVRYAPERLADALELLGATLLDEFGDAWAALAEWQAATALRWRHGALPKRGWVAAESGCGQARRALAGAREWRTAQDLHAAMEDPEGLRLQALLVMTRVLGPSHKDVLFRLMYRGAALADAGRYQRCAELWTWALSERLRRDTVLHGDSCHAACALARLLAHWRLPAHWRPRHGDVLRVFTLLARHLPEGARLLALRPRSRAQADCFDRALRCAAHLVLALELAATDATELAAGRRAVRALLAHELHSAHTGDTLLHLAVSRLNFIRSTYFTEEHATQPLFPSLVAVRALLACGARPDALNQSRSTPLHVAAIPYNFNTDIVNELLAYGAHFDQPNRFGDSAADLVVLNRGSRVLPLRHITLRCLAARALLSPGAPPTPPGALPNTLLAFLRLHEPTGRPRAR